MIQSEIFGVMVPDSRVASALRLRRIFTEAMLIQRPHPDDDAIVALRNPRTGEKVALDGMKWTLRADIPAVRLGQDDFLPWKRCVSL